MTVKQIVDSILQKQGLFLCGLVSTERDRVIAELLQTVQDAQVQQRCNKTLETLQS